MEKRHLKSGTKDRAELENLLRKGSLPVKVCKRAMALLELDMVKNFGVVAQTPSVCYQSVSLWCTRYKTEGLSMLWDAARSGRPVEIDGEQRAKITALACSHPPRGICPLESSPAGRQSRRTGLRGASLTHNEAGKMLKK